MKKNIVTAIIVLFASSTILLATDAKVLATSTGPFTHLRYLTGTANNAWYVSTLSGNKKPIDYTVNVYQQGTGATKTYKLQTNWGEYSTFLSSAIINNKFSVFYAQYDKKPVRNEMNIYYPQGWGDANAPRIYRQDYDVSTLKPIGGPDNIFDVAKDGYGVCGFNLAVSDDKSKTAIILIGLLAEKKYKLLVYDNKAGLLYTKDYTISEGKKYVYPQFRVSNDGHVLLMVKETASGHNSFGKSAFSDITYSFISVDAQGNATKPLGLKSEGNKCFDDPIAHWLTNGQIAIAYGIYKNGGGPTLVVESMDVLQYDAGLKLLTKKNIPADDKLMQQANEIDAAKGGYHCLVLNDIVPLTGGNFVLVAECSRAQLEGGTSGSVEVPIRNYGIIYRFNDKLELTNTTFLPKRQKVEQEVQFLASIRPYHIGDDVYLFYNDGFQKKAVEEMQLFCMHLPATGEADISKVIKTNNYYISSIEDVISTNTGKLLMEAPNIKYIFTPGTPKSPEYIEINCSTPAAH